MKAVEEVNQERSDQPAEKAFRSLLRVVGLMSRMMQPYFTRLGISPSQWGVLRTLHRAEEEGTSGLYLIELGNRLLVTPPTVTGLVDRLQRLGYVVRTSTSCDLRCKEVQLTPDGRQLVLRVLQGHRAQVEGIMAGLESRELRTFNVLLEKVAADLQHCIRHREQAASTTKVQFGNRGPEGTGPGVRV